MLNKFEDILAQCIDDVKAGRASIEDCLDRYPSLRERLEPLLRIALDIRETPDVKPSVAFKIKARVQLMEQIHERQTVTKWPWSRYNKQTKQIPLRRRFSMVSIIVAIILTLSAVGGGVAYASQGSLPGDALYPIKLGTEQIGMALPGGDVARAERALSFANRRIGEMEALAEKGRSQDLGVAVGKYDYALDMALARIEQASAKGLATGNVTALVAEATTHHLLVLDKVWDIVPGEAKTAIAHARNVSETGYFHALETLAQDNPVRATEMNLAAMDGRLNRVRARVGDVEAVEDALQQFEAMAEFGEEISQIAREIGLNITSVEELVAEATCIHLEVLADVWERVPEQAQPAIERAMANLMIRHQKRVQALKGMGVELPFPVIPEKIRERVEERIREREQGILGDTTPPMPGVPGGVPPGRP